MIRTGLWARRVLIAEDQLLIAVDLAEAFEQEGAYVVGPVSTVKRAMSLLNNDDNLDYAILDLNLADDLVYTLADALSARHVPFMFTTGCRPSEIPSRFGNIAVIEKPAIVDAALNKVKNDLGQRSQRA